jgi:predicted CopG family antitoxin
MKNILITENQLRLITEALGVPDTILDASEQVFDSVAQDIKSIRTKKDEYTFRGNVGIQLGDKKKIDIDDYELIVNVTHPDGYDEEPQIASMGMAQSFHFDRSIMMKRIQKSSTAEIEIDYVVPENWEPSDLYDTLMRDKRKHLASIAHELKHKYDKQAKEIDLIGREALYHSTMKMGRSGIPAIDSGFMRALYFVSMTENLVRPVEIAALMKSKNITKSQFKDFLMKTDVYRELQHIKNYTFEDFINELKERMDRIDALLEYMDVDGLENMSEDDKIKKVLEIIYATITNVRLDIFQDMISNKQDDLMDMFKDLFGQDLRKNDPQQKKLNQVRNKFYNYAAKYKDNPVKFFEDEFENFNYTSNKVLKRLSKMYAMAQDDEQPVSESILNWELYQKVREQKNGKMKFDTEIRKK